LRRGDSVVTSWLATISPRLVRLKVGQAQDLFANRVKAVSQRGPAVPARSRRDRLILTVVQSSLLPSYGSGIS
jgi:hypothetical protein